jgi:sugar/nucleoside kinase (ribokinase family)
MSVLVVGTLGFDSVQTPHGMRAEVLGGSASFLATAAAYHGPVILAGVVGQDFPAEHLAFFAERQIDVANVQRAAGQTFRWHGHYTPDMSTAQTLRTDLNVLLDFDPKLDERGRAADVVVLGNFDPRLQARVLSQVHKPRFVACDTMNYWIERHREALLETLTQVDLLCVNEAEARQLSGQSQLIDAAQAILEMGPRNVVIKCGEHGAMLVYPGGAFATPAYSFARVLDPTGAGDTFAGSLAGFVARHREPTPEVLRHAVAMGTIMASFTVEDFSLDRLRRLSADQVRARAQDFLALTSLSPAQLLEAMPAEAAVGA